LSQNEEEKGDLISYKTNSDDTPEQIENISDNIYSSDDIQYFDVRFPDNNNSNIIILNATSLEQPIIISYIKNQKISNILYFCIILDGNGGRLDGG
ncbi:13969_t:CDS:2, partial [Entrophospora sp. SA101]